MVRSEMIARVAFQQTIIDTWSSAVDRPAVIEGTARAHTGFAWFDIAVCHVILGHPIEAAEAFARAAAQMHASLASMSPPALATYAASLESAVLSGDRALASRLAANASEPELRPSLLGDRLAWAQALPALVADDDDRATSHARTASAVSANKAWYPGLGPALEAIVAAEEPSLTAAIERMLVKHARYARSKKSWCYNAGPCLLCVPAVVLLRLAARRGMTVSEPRGRRAVIPFTLVHSEQPTGTVTIEADFLPDALTDP